MGASRASKGNTTQVIKPSKAPLLSWRAPAESWWADAPRSTFPAIVAKQQERMAGSKGSYAVPLRILQ